MAQTKTKSKSKTKTQSKSKPKASSSKTQSPTEKSSRSSSRAKQGRSRAQSHQIEPTQLKFRWISAGQTERPGNGHRCGSACGSRWSRGDPCPQRPRAAAEAGEKPETDRSAVGRFRDRLGREESYGCRRRRRQGRADDLDRPQGQEGPELNMAPEGGERESRAVRRGTRGRRGLHGSPGRRAEIRDRPRDEGLVRGRAGGAVQLPNRA